MAATEDRKQWKIEAILLPCSVLILLFSYCWHFTIKWTLSVRSAVDRKEASPGNQIIIPPVDVPFRTWRRTLPEKRPQSTIKLYTGGLLPPHEFLHIETNRIRAPGDVHYEGSLTTVMYAARRINIPNCIKRKQRQNVEQIYQGIRGWSAEREEVTQSDRLDPHMTWQCPALNEGDCKGWLQGMTWQAGRRLDED